MRRTPLRAVRNPPARIIQIRFQLFGNQAQQTDGKRVGDLSLKPPVARDIQFPLFGMVLNSHVQPSRGMTWDASEGFAENFQTIWYGLPLVNGPARPPDQTRLRLVLAPIE